MKMLKRQMQIIRFNLRLLSLVLPVFIAFSCVTPSKSPSGDQLKAPKPEKAPKATPNSGTVSRQDVSKTIRSSSFLPNEYRPPSVGNYNAKLGRGINDVERRIAASSYQGTSDDTDKRLAQNYMTLRLKKEPKADIGEDIKLDLAISAVRSKRFDVAEFYLNELMDSKNSAIAAAALNATGVIAIEENRIPEAAEAFRKAVEKSSSEKSAPLNLGLLALKFGDFKNAQRYLGRLDPNWYVDMNKAIAQRNMGSPSGAIDFCKDVEKKYSSNRVVLFNCGVVAYQNQKNMELAKRLLSKSAKISGGDSSWDSRTYKILEKLK